LDQNINQVLSLAGWKINHLHFPNTTITFRHLLDHESGIRDNWDSLSLWYHPGDPTLSLGDALHGYLADPHSIYYHSGNWFHIPPGQVWKYSHIGASLMAYLIEILVGEKFSEYTEKHIFRPLEMWNTHWFYEDYKENISRCAFPHVYNVELSIYRTLSHYGFADYPDGGLKTTVADFWTFIQMLLNGGTWRPHARERGEQRRERRILTPQSVNLMLELKPMQGEFDRQTYGLWRLWSGRTVVGHDGGERGWRAIVGFDPVTKDGLIWFSNAWPRCNCMISLAQGIYDNWFGTLSSQADPHERTNNQNSLTPKPTLDVHGRWENTKWP